MGNELITKMRLYYLKHALNLRWPEFIRINYRIKHFAHINGFNFVLQRRMKQEKIQQLNPFDRKLHKKPPTIVYNL